MAVKIVLVSFGLIYLGLLVPKILAELMPDNINSVDNKPKKLFPSSAKPMEQDDKTDMMQKTESSQSKITSRNTELQSNMIGSTTFNKGPFTRETMDVETTNKEGYFTRTILSSDEKSENILVNNNSNRITEGNNSSSFSIITQNSTTNKLSSVQPSTTKPVEERLFNLHVTNATETSISVSWNATENMKRFRVSIAELLPSTKKYNDIPVDTTSVTITNLTCSGCYYNISVKSFYGEQNFSQSVYTTNYTVPMMPVITVKENPTSVIITISMKDNKNCTTLKNDKNWEITTSESSEGTCQIEQSDLEKHVNYSLKIWRQVDVWESKKQVISIHLRTEPNAVRNISHKYNDKEIYISWQEPNGLHVTSYMINISVKNPCNFNSTSTTTTTNMTHYTIKNFLPGSQYTVAVYAVNSVGKSPVNSLTFNTSSGIPHAVNISINYITADSVTISLRQPSTFKGNILGYLIEIYKVKKRLMIYNIKHQNCSQAYISSSNRCSCSQPCNNMKEKTLHGLTDPFSLGALTPYTRYSISAQAYTSDGCGNKSKIEFMTIESAPSKVQHLKIVSKSSKLAVVEWQEPKYPNGKIQYYLINLFDHSNTSIVSQNITARNFTFENLKPFQNYTINIVAVNSIKGIKRIFYFKTNMEVPEPVQLNIVNVTSKYIIVMWKPPQYPNGPIKNYSIFWKKVQEKFFKSKLMFLNTTYTITNLEPYRTYEIKVEICNTLYCKPSDLVEQKTMIGVPYNVRNVTAKAESATSICVYWQEPTQFTGPTTYIIQINSLETPNISHHFRKPHIVRGFNNTSIVIKDLKEYWPYTFSITTNTTAGKSATVKSLITYTEESKPGPVESLDIYVNYSCLIALIVTWKKPLRRDENGIILNYEITYWADNNEKKNVSVNATQFSKTMVVYGEHNYTIQIRAANSKGLGDIKSKTVYVKPQTPIVPKDVFVTKANIEVDDSSRQIAINLPNEFFTDFRFGIPIKWGLVITQSEVVNSSALEHREIDPDKLKQWKDVYDSDITDPYRPTPSYWKPPVILAQGDGSHYILGAQEDCEDEIYCNGYLKPNTQYRVKAFMCTKGGCSATRYSKSMHTDKDLTPIYITIPVLLIAAAVAVNIIFIMWNKKLYCFKKKPITTVSSLVDANQNGKVNHSFTVKNPENSRPIMLAHFHSKVEMMKRDSNVQFCEEFKLLKSLSPVQPHVAAELQVNRTKNRYTNILAYDHSRVKLLPFDDDEDSDYINANYIPGYSLLREYIAAQGPLHSTKDDFWRMIWEQNVSIVVMVTLPVERGRIKCEDYWPKGSEPVYFGDLVVQLKSESNLSDYVIRIMDVILGESTREVKQFHFLKWPDFGCPHNTSLLINFVQTVRTHMPYMATGPTLVHCSAGVGRTGTFIVIDRLLQHMQNHYDVDIFGLILELRNFRPNMVQTEDQYIYIYQCIADHLKQMEKADTQDIYMNETGM